MEFGLEQKWNVEQWCGGDFDSGWTSSDERELFTWAMEDTRSRVPSNRDAGGGELKKFVNIVINSCKIFNDKLIRNNASFKKYCKDCWETDNRCADERDIQRFASPLCSKTLKRLRKAILKRRDQMDDVCLDNFTYANNDEGYHWREDEPDYSFDSDFDYAAPELFEQTQSITKREEQDKKRKKKFDLKNYTDLSQLMFDFKYDPVKGFCLVCSRELKMARGKSKKDQQSRAKTWDLHRSGKHHQSALARWPDKKCRMLNSFGVSAPAAVGGSARTSASSATDSTNVANNAVPATNANKAVPATTANNAAPTTTANNDAPAITVNNTTPATASATTANNPSSATTADNSATAPTASTSTTTPLKRVKLETYWVGPYTNKRNGKQYWHNSKTKESSYKRPRACNPPPDEDATTAAPLKRVKLETYWVGPYTNKRNGKQYWYNKDTKESSYNRPDKFIPPHK